MTDQRIVLSTSPNAKFAAFLEPYAQSKAARIKQTEDILRSWGFQPSNVDCDLAEKIIQLGPRPENKRFCFTCEKIKPTHLFSTKTRCRQCRAEDDKLRYEKENIKPRSDGGVNSFNSYMKTTNG